MDSEPFVYQQGKHKKTTMSYWLVPKKVMQDKHRIKEWVDKSVAVSRASKKINDNRAVVTLVDNVSLEAVYYAQIVLGADCNIDMTTRQYLSPSECID